MALLTRLPFSSTFVQASYAREHALFLRSFHPLYIAADHPDGYFAFFGLQDAPEVDKPEVGHSSFTFLRIQVWSNKMRRERRLEIKSS
jgi:hypothetical protein